MYAEGAITKLIDIPSRVFASLVTATTSAAMLYAASPRLLVTMGGALLIRDICADFVGSFFKELRRKLAHRISDPDYMW
jgi:hypothetical protein